MSCFGGLMQEYTRVSLDRFDGQNLQSTVYFLSHLHEDHTKGLDGDLLLKRLKSNKEIFLYCSEVTKVLIEASPKYRKISPYVKCLDINTPTIITIPDPLYEEREEITVTLLPAFHCPGSVMVLIEGNEGTVLYTGDFRWEHFDIEHMHQLRSADSVKKIKSLYVDTTFCDPANLHIPSRQQCIDAVYQIVREWTSQSPQHVVYIQLRSYYGHEPLINSVASRLNKKVHVGQHKHDVYEKIHEFSGNFTSDGTSTQLHACDRKCTIEVDGETVSCKDVHDPEHVLYILPTTMYFTQFQQVSLEKIVKRIHSNFYRACYSFHSSYTEVKDLLAYLKPEKVYANVKCPKDNTLNETQHRLNVMLKECLEHGAGEGTPVEMEVKELGTLKTKPAYKTRKRKGRESPSDSESLNFGSPVKQTPSEDLETVVTGGRRGRKRGRGRGKTTQESVSQPVVSTRRSSRLSAASSVEEVTPPKKRKTSRRSTTPDLSLTPEKSTPDDGSEIQSSFLGSQRSDSELSLFSSQKSHEGSILSGYTETNWKAGSFLAAVSSNEDSEGMFFVTEDNQEIDESSVSDDDNGGNDEIDGNDENMDKKDDNSVTDKSHDDVIDLVNEINQHIDDTDEAKPPEVDSETEADNSNSVINLTAEGSQEHMDISDDSKSTNGNVETITQNTVTDINQTDKLNECKNFTDTVTPTERAAETKIENNVNDVETPSDVEDIPEQSSDLNLHLSGSTVSGSFEQDSHMQSVMYESSKDVAPNLNQSVGDSLKEGNTSHTVPSNLPNDNGDHEVTDLTKDKIEISSTDLPIDEAVNVVDSPVLTKDKGELEVSGLSKEKNDTGVIDVTKEKVDIEECVVLDSDSSEPMIVDDINDTSKDADKEKSINSYDILENVTENNSSLAKKDEDICDKSPEVAEDKTRNFRDVEKDDDDVVEIVDLTDEDLAQQYEPQETPKLGKKPIKISLLSKNVVPKKQKKLIEDDPEDIDEDTNASLVSKGKYDSFLTNNSVRKSNLIKSVVDENDKSENEVEKIDSSQEWLSASKAPTKKSKLLTKTSNSGIKSSSNLKDKTDSLKPAVPSKELEERAELKRQAMGFVCETDSESDSDESTPPNSPTPQILYDDYIELSSDSDEDKDGGSGSRSRSNKGPGRNARNNNDGSNNQSSSGGSSSSSGWLRSQKGRGHSDDGANAGENESEKNDQIEPERNESIDDDPSETVETKTNVSDQIEPERNESIDDNPSETVETKTNVSDQIEPERNESIDDDPSETVEAKTNASDQIEPVEAKTNASDQIEPERNESMDDDSSETLETKTNTSDQVKDTDNTNNDVSINSEKESDTGNVSSEKGSQSETGIVSSEKVLKSGFKKREPSERKSNYRSNQVTEDDSLNSIEIPAAVQAFGPLSFASSSKSTLPKSDEEKADDSKSEKYSTGSNDRQSDEAATSLLHPSVPSASENSSISYPLMVPRRFQAESPRSQMPRPPSTYGAPVSQQNAPNMYVTQAAWSGPPNMYGTQYPMSMPLPNAYSTQYPLPVPPPNSLYTGVPMSMPPPTMPVPPQFSVPQPVPPPNTFGSQVPQPVPPVSDSQNTTTKPASGKSKLASWQQQKAKRFQRGPSGQLDEYLKTVKPKTSTSSQQLFPISAEYSDSREDDYHYRPVSNEQFTQPATQHHTNRPVDLASIKANISAITGLEVKAEKPPASKPKVTEAPGETLDEMVEKLRKIEQMKALLNVVNGQPVDNNIQSGVVEQTKEVFDYAPWTASENSTEAHRRPMHRETMDERLSYDQEHPQRRRRSESEDYEQWVEERRREEYHRRRPISPPYHEKYPYDHPPRPPRHPREELDYYDHPPPLRQPGRGRHPPPHARGRPPHPRDPEFRRGPPPPHHIDEYERLPPPHPRDLEYEQLPHDLEYERLPPRHHHELDYDHPPPPRRRPPPYHPDSGHERHPQPPPHYQDEHYDRPPHPAHRDPPYRRLPAPPSELVDPYYEEPQQESVDRAYYKPDIHRPESARPYTEQSTRGERRPPLLRHGPQQTESRYDQHQVPSSDQDYYQSEHYEEPNPDTSGVYEQRHDQYGNINVQSVVNQSGDNTYNQQTNQTLIKQTPEPKLTPAKTRYLITRHRPKKPMMARVLSRSGQVLSIAPAGQILPQQQQTMATPEK